MSSRGLERETAAARPEVADSEPVESLPLAAKVLALQRSAGNQATAQFLRSHLAPRPPGARVLARRLVRTGPGAVRTDSRVPAGGIRVVLSNYDVDGDAIKPEHRDFLDREVIPRLVGRSARAWLQGSASHSGEDDYNQRLSERRVDHVIDYLKSHGALDSQVNRAAVGESMATPGVNEAQEDRAVSILVAPLTAPPPPPPAPAPSIPTSTAFRIRMLGGLSVGTFGLQADQLYFQIWDHAHSLTSFYVYFAGGAGRSVRLPLSATLQGPWNDFTVTRAIRVNDFGGPARFTSGGSAWFTWNYLNMMGLPPGAATVPRSMRISTGFTMGIGAGTTVGDMRIVDPTPWPFSGP